MVDAGTLILRAVVGAILFAHGVHKFQLLQELNRIWSDDFGLPIGSVALSGVLQIAGGLALVAGVFTRYMALVQIAVMLVAAYVSIWKRREPFLSTPQGKGWDFNVLLTAALVSLALVGDGAWSVAELLR